MLESLLNPLNTWSRLRFCGATSSRDRGRTLIIKVAFWIKRKKSYIYALTKILIYDN